MGFLTGAKSVGWVLRVTVAGALWAAFGATSFAADPALNPQEEELAASMLGAEGQERPALELDPILCSVARARANDMGVRRYFGHVNPDGEAANYLIEAAGYPLPESWPDEPDANNVESIAAGYATALSVWRGWLGSAHHRTHLLGQDDFFRSHDRFGVGYASVPGSPYTHYWVVITAPAPIDPRLTIDAPAEREAVLTESVDVQGTSSGAVAVAVVEVRVENEAGSGEWILAVGTDDWNATVGGLVPGENTVRARSLDSEGAAIVEVTRKIRYLVLEPLEVRVEGDGAVTEGFEGTSLRELAANYEIRAIPAPGMIFSGWEGSAVSSEAVLRFRMESDFHLVARFAPDPILLAVGKHFGYLQTEVGPALVTVTVTRVGGITVAVNGPAWKGWARVGLKGEGETTVKIGKNLLGVALDAGGAISVAMADGAAAALQPLAFNRISAPHPYAGSYTAVLLKPEPWTGSEVGDGFLLVQVDGGGGVRVTGSTGDGTAVSGRGYLGGDGVLEFGVGLARGAGSIYGTVDLASASLSDGGAGTFAWTNAALGTTTQIEAVASVFLKNRAEPFGWGIGLARFDGGQLAAPVETTVNAAGTRLAGADAAGSRVEVRVNRGTGLVTGKATGAAYGGRVDSRGVVLQKIATVSGYFKGKVGVGLMEIGPVAMP
jgi:uncharacterized protein YkwD